MRRSSLATALAGLATTAPATAQNYYDGKQLSLVIGVEAGPGYDAYGRMVARNMTRFLPGKPNIIVQNMPGAGTAKAAEYIYGIAPKDGTVFGMIFPGTLLGPLTEPGKYRFDPTEIRLCRQRRYRRAHVHHLQDVEDQDVQGCLTAPSVFGGAQPGAAITDYAQMVVNLAGAKFKIVNGYRSTLPIVLAMERGEVDGMCGIDLSSVRAMRADWVGTGEINVLVQMSLVPSQDLLKQGIPSLWDFVDRRRTGRQPSSSSRSRSSSARSSPRPRSLRNDWPSCARLSWMRSPTATRWPRRTKWA